MLKLVAAEAFEVFISGDKAMRDQQNLTGRPFAILILSAIHWPVVRPHVGRIAGALAEARPGTVTMIDCGFFGTGPGRSA